MTVDHKRELHENATAVSKRLSEWSDPKAAGAHYDANSYAHQLSIPQVTIEARKAHYVTGQGTHKLKIDKERAKVLSEWVAVDAENARKEWKDAAMQQLEDSLKSAS